MYDSKVHILVNYRTEKLEENKNFVREKKCIVIYFLLLAMTWSLQVFSLGTIEYITGILATSCFSVCGYLRSSKTNIIYCY